MRTRNFLLFLIIALLMGSHLAAAVRPSHNPNPQNKPAGDKTTDPDGVSGTYVGVAKSRVMGDVSVKFDLKVENRKLIATMDTAQGKLTSTSGTYSNGKIMARFEVGGNAGSVTAEYKKGIITGEWEFAGQTGIVELKKVEAAEGESKSPGTTKTEEKVPDLISGEWNVLAEAPGAPLSFKLKLKVDGDKVSGESRSAEGNFPIRKGSWVANKLNLTFDGPHGAAVLTGTLKDGKLVGDYDFGEQMKGKWEGKRN